MPEFPHVLQVIEETIGDNQLVVVNVEPFETTIAQRLNYDDGLKTIDVARIAVIRAAAKTPDITVVVDPEDYQLVQMEIEASGKVSIELRQRLAAKAFAYVAAY